MSRKTSNEPKFKRRRTQCQKFKKKNGKIIKVDKFSYKSHSLAQTAADLMNIEVTDNKKLVAYKCSKCELYHIGRDGSKLKYEDIKEAASRIKNAPTIRGRTKGQKLKVIGKIDLDNISRDVYEWNRKKANVSSNPQVNRKVDKSKKSWIHRILSVVKSFFMKQK